MGQNEELTIEQKLRRVNKLKKDLDDVKVEKDQKIGERNGLLGQLKQQFGADNLTNGKRRIKNIEEQLNRRNKTIDSLFDKLSEQYDF